MDALVQQVASTWRPRVVIILRPDGSGAVVINGTSEPVKGNDRDAVMDQALERVRRLAVGLGAPVRVEAEDPDGEWVLEVAPDGRVSEVPTEQSSDPDDPQASSIAEDFGDLVEEEEELLAPSTPIGSQADRDVPAAGARKSFLTGQRREEPAETGWRGFLARCGLRVSPGATEKARRSDVAAVSQHWPGPRTIVVVNGKGGANKTPSTILLSATLARFGGSGVLAWDNNQTRGTLGWRTEQGPHEATLLDLLPVTDDLLGPSAKAADLARYVHHQTKDRYDVLRSKPMALATEQRFETSDVDALHAVAAKYYRLIVMDSGNDESDPMWQRMVDLADQLVVATTTRDDHAEAGALLLEGLAARDERSSRLAAQAVVIVSQADQRATRGDVARVATGYAQLARDVVTIPWDPAMVGGVLRLGALRPPTQRAWLAAAAATARGLSDRGQA